VVVVVRGVVVVPCWLLLLSFCGLVSSFSLGLSAVKVSYTILEGFLHNSSDLCLKRLHVSDSFSFLVVLSTEKFAA